MSTSREIITIQAGNFSNFVGTHWWNSQESSFCYDAQNSAALEINHDVLFREVLTFQGEVTYTPRLVLIDLESNLRSICKVCPLYQSAAGENYKQVLWDGKVDEVRTNPVKRNLFLKEANETDERSNESKSESKQPETLSENPDFYSSETGWSDFLKTNLHPQSLCLFNESDSTEEKNPFELYSYGDELWKSTGCNSIEDSIRKGAEECDYLQGFHILFDAHNAFAGVSHNILQFLNDEYDRKSIIGFPSFQDASHSHVQDTNKQMHRLFAILQSFNSLNSCSSLFCPLSMFDDVVQLLPPAKNFPFIHHDANVPYQTSAIFAMAMETLTSSYRSKNSKFHLNEVASSMSAYDRKLVASSISLPFPLRPDQYLTDMLEKEAPEYHLVSLTPFYKPESERTLFQSAVLRGIPENKFKNAKKSHHLSSKEDIFGEFLNKYSASAVATVTVINEKCNVSFPFPNVLKIADPLSGSLNTCATFNAKGLEKVPVAASLSNSDSAGNFIEDLISQTNKRHFKLFTEASFEKDLFREVIENLTNLQYCYQDY